MDRRMSTPPNDLLRHCMRAIRSNRNHDDATINEDRADRELVAYTQKVMRDSLAAARMKGRRGWWRQAECTIEYLEKLLHEAQKRNDLISVINYAAMLQVRRITDE